MNIGLTYYFIWMVPSSLSLFGSILMIVNVLLVPALRSHQYQQMCLILATSDIIQSLSSMLAPKYSAPYSMCIFQEYLFIVSSLTEAFATVMICCVTWIIVTSLNAVPKRKFYIIFAIVMVVLPVLCLLLFSLYRAYDVFCINPGESRTSDIAYYTTFILPLVGCVAADFAFYFMMTRRFKQIVSGSTDEAVSAFYQSSMLKMVRKVIAFPVVFALGWAMEIVLITYYVLAGEGANSNDLTEIVLSTLASLTVSFTGICVAGLYFRQQRSLAPSVKRILDALRVVLCCCGGGVRVESKSTARGFSSAPHFPGALSDSLMERGREEDSERASGVGTTFSSMFSVDIHSLDSEGFDDVVMVK
jgi:hypothetical protein